MEIEVLYETLGQWKNCIFNAPAHWFPTQSGRYMTGMSLVLEEDLYYPKMSLRRTFRSLAGRVHHQARGPCFPKKTQRQTSHYAEGRLAQAGLVVRHAPQDALAVTRRYKRIPKSL